MAESNPSNPESPEFRAGRKLKGRVTRIELFGAFVDVGAPFEGLVHISRLKRGKVARVQEAVQEGQEVEVWVERFDPASERLELTMIRPVELKWQAIQPGMSLTGRVTRVERFGAFVDIGAERPGLVHVSEMDDGYVSDPSQQVQVGDEVEVSVLEVDPAKKQIRLTMKVQVMPEVDEEHEYIPTAMEVALREALQGREKAPQSDPAAEQPPSGKKKPPARKRRRGEQEELLARTLSQRARTSADRPEQK